MSDSIFDGTLNNSSATTLEVRNLDQFQTNTVAKTINTPAYTGTSNAISESASDLNTYDLIYRPIDVNLTAAVTVTITLPTAATLVAAMKPTKINAVNDGFKFKYIVDITASTTTDTLTLIITGGTGTTVIRPNSAHTASGSVNYVVDVVFTNVTSGSEACTMYFHK